MMVLLLLGSVVTSTARDELRLNGSVAAFVRAYGAPKELDTVLGRTRLWQKGKFAITHIEGRYGRNSISVGKLRGEDDGLNRREAFFLGERFCGKQEWSLTSKDHKSEVYTSGDRAYRLTFSSKVDEVQNGHVTITFLPLTKEIEAL